MESVVSESRDEKNVSGNGAKNETEVTVDDTDAWFFSKSKAKDKTDSVSKLTTLMSTVTVKAKYDRDAECYHMSHGRRGTAIIFNHIHFAKHSTRTGTVKDADNLANALQKLGFEVKLYNDPSLITISAVLRAAAESDHSDADCLVVSAMSHGESGFLHTYEEMYPVDKLWSSFTADNCPSLAGKPKLFFIQACRGQRLDKGVKVIHETDAVAGNSYSIPSYADIMVAYSTYDGFYSWRNPDAGSWFVQAICKELEIHGETRDLLTVMTFVNRRVALDFQSYVPQNEKMNASKQIPSVVSMLTRLVYFKDNSRSDSRDE